MPLRYGGEGTVYEGLLKDLSVGGGGITGTVPVSVGMVLRVQLCVPGELEPLLIDRALVRWVKRLEFGVEFEQVPTMVDARLYRLISALIYDQRGICGPTCGR
jgi:hypothetical protein